MARLLLALSVLCLLCLAPCDSSTWKGRLVVTIVRAWDLKGDIWGATDSYVKMWFGPHYRRTWVIRSNNPRWNARYDLGLVDTRLNLNIQVWDKDLGPDDRLGSCLKPVFRGTRSFTCYAKKGGVEVHYTLTCAPGLTGFRCNRRFRPPLPK